MAFFVNNTKVIENDASISLYDARPGSFNLPILVNTTPGTTYEDAGITYASGTQTNNTRPIWNGGFDYTKINANTAFKLTAYDGAASDQYGHSVAVGSGVIVVGAPGDDDNGSSSGSVYLYNIKGTLIKKIKPSDGAAGDNFGWSVAVGSGRVVVGAPGSDTNGNQSGAVYIFDLAGENQVKANPGVFGGAFDQLGYSVAIGCNRIIAGAPYDGERGVEAGKAFLFKRDGTFLRSLIAADSYNIISNAGDRFGWSVAVNNGRIAVGAPFNVGAVYLYDLGGSHIKTIRELPYTPMSLPITRVSRTTGSSTYTATLLSVSNTTITDSTGTNYGPTGYNFGGGGYTINYTPPGVFVGQYVKFLGSIFNAADAGAWRITSVTGDTFTFNVGYVSGASGTLTLSNFQSPDLRRTKITETAADLAGSITSFVADGTTIVVANVSGLNRPIPPVRSLVNISKGFTAASLPINGTWRVFSSTSTSFTFITSENVPAGTYGPDQFNRLPGSYSFDDTSGKLFGYSVSLGSGRLAVGCPDRRYYDESTYVERTSFNNSMYIENPGDFISYGVVYNYDLNGTYCGAQAANVGFTRTVVGTPDPPQPNISNLGVYLETTYQQYPWFTLQNTTAYNSTSTYTAPLSTLGSRLGHSVSIGNGFLVSGSPLSDINSVVDAGSVYVSSCKTTFAGNARGRNTLSTNENYIPRTQFTPVGYLDKRLISLYSLPAIFPNTTSVASDQFGYSVACGWDTILISAPFENTPAGVDAGAVYVFKIEENMNGHFEKILDAYGKED